jgi:hypothetical protein
VTSLVQPVASGDNGGTATTSYTPAFASSITPGSGVVVAIASPGTLTSVTPASGPDTFTAAVAEDGIACLYYCLASAGGYKGITLGQSSSDRIFAWLYETPPLASVDRTSGNTAATSPWTSGTTAATTQPDEFWAGVACLDGGGIASPASPWVNGSLLTAGTSAALSGYQFTTAEGAAAYTAAQSLASTYWAAVATFVLASAPVAAGRRGGLSQAVNRSATY